MIDKEWLAFKLYSVGNYVEAESLFRELVTASHRAGVQNFYLGNLLAKTGREEEAVRCWRQTISLIPKDVKAKKAKARIEKLAAAQADLSGAFGDGNQHDVHDADAGREQSNGAD